MRICVINNVLDEKSSRLAMQAMLEECVRGLLDEATQVEVRGLAHAPSHLEAGVEYYRDSFFQLLATVEIVRSIVRAAADGFDAVVVNCFDDYGVEPARSVVPIPVIGIGAASLSFAAQIGRRVGLIVPNLPGQVDYATRQIQDLGLAQSLLPRGIRVDAMPFAEAWVEAMADQAAAIRRFAPLARALAEDGADSVVFGCGGFSLVCGAQRFNQVQATAGTVPVVIPINVALMQAEMLARLRRSGLDVSARTRGSFLHSPATTRMLLEKFGIGT
ncbi:MAG: aspartate/glutamate racemase family protein [Proteobacteria bacterium]|nr:aspartate/glutamate racemase family protein [Pseudomonadota bacterium]